MEWRFYGRDEERDLLGRMVDRERWFFARITGRRRIGKTALVRRVLERRPHRPVVYVQLPDAAPPGVLAAFRDALDVFDVPRDLVSPPSTLLDLARAVRTLVERGYVVAIDEFQYANRAAIAPLTSHLQTVVDDLAATSRPGVGGLLVLGSIHADLVALLEDRRAPLYARTTDDLELSHLDVASVLRILADHATPDPYRLLFFWNLFEGVPKFYRDAFERGVLAADRTEALSALFFRSSSPLRSEAERWFLAELRGRYDTVLQYVARHPGCTHADLVDHVRRTDADGSHQVASYLKALEDRFAMIERRRPIFASAKGRKSRYYVRDTFLRSWLGALQAPASALAFRPEADLVARADDGLRRVEGYGLERLVRTLYEERSRKGVGDFPLGETVGGFWNRGDADIDLVAVHADERRIRVGTVKRDAARLLPSLDALQASTDALLARAPRYREWTIEPVAVAPVVDRALRATLEARGVRAQDLHDLTEDLL